MDNVDGAILTLAFRVPVNVSLFNSSSFTIRNNNTTSPSVYYQIKSCAFNYSDDNNATRRCRLSVLDTDNLKLLSKNGFATLATNTWLAVSSNSGIKDQLHTQDMHRARVDEDSIPSLFSGVIPDSTAPFMTSFRWFNSNLSTFQLEFNEPILASSFNASAIRFGSTYSDVASINLRNSTVATYEDGRIFIITLGSADIDALDSSRRVCTESSNCYISFESTLFTDMNKNPITPLVNFLNFATLVLRQPSNFIADTLGPVLTNFSLNMNSGTIVLVFSKEIDISTFDPKGITIQGAQTFISATPRYTLTGGVVSGTKPHMITISLLLNDFSNIKKTQLLATDASTTYLSITGTVVNDLVNPIPLSNQVIVQSNALITSLFIRDSVSPTIIAFSLFVDLRKLIVTFDEPVLATVTSVNVSLLTLMSDIGGANLIHLSSMTTFVGDHSSIIEFSIVFEDIVQISASKAIGTSLNLTVLRVQTGAFNDVAQNTINEIFLYASAVAASPASGPALAPPAPVHIMCDM